MGTTSANRLTGQSGGLDGDTLGATGGAETHTLEDSQSGLPAHTVPSGTVTAHGIDTDQGDNVNHIRIFTSNRGSSTTVPATNGAVPGADAADAHNNVQPTIILNYIIKT